MEDLRCSHGPSHIWTPKQAICEFQNLSLSKRGQVQNLSRENEFYLHENKKKIIFISKASHLASL